MSAEEIIDNFQIAGPVTSIEPFGGGHINDTYYVKCQNSGNADYLLQKVNSYVFKDIEGLMNNISVVTTHLRNKLYVANVKDVESRSLELFLVILSICQIGPKKLCTNLSITFLPLYFSYR